MRPREAKLSFRAWTSPSHQSRASFSRSRRSGYSRMPASRQNQFPNTSCTPTSAIRHKLKWMRLVSLFCITCALLAQSNPDPLEQAWTAHSILEQRLTSRIPDLVRILESPDGSSRMDAAKFAALDALIQLDAPVPLADLEPLVDHFPTDVFILASRSKEDSTALLLKLLDRPHNREAFTAIGNLLAPQRVPGFAKAAMKQFCQRATLYVVNPDRPRNSGGAWSGDSYRMTDPQREGWPETGSYQLRGSAVSFSRTVDRSYIDHGFD